MSNVLARNIDSTKIEFAKELNVLPNGMCVLNYQYNKGKTLTIQTPEMFCPFAVSDYQGNEKYSINLSMGTDSNDKKSVKKARRIDEFKIAIESVNDTLIDHVFKNQKVYFGFKKLKTREQLIEEHFSNMIKTGKEKDDGSGSYNDMYRITVKPDQVNVVNKTTKEELDFKELTDLAFYDATVIYKITGAWISKSLKKFGFFSRCSLIQVSPTERPQMEMQTYDSDSETELDDISVSSD